MESEQPKRRLDAEESGQFLRAWAADMRVGRERWQDYVFAMQLEQLRREEAMRDGE